MNSTQRTSGLAIASLILGLAGVMCSLLTTIPAIICGHIARAQIKRDESLGGGGVAMAGLVVGYGMSVLTVLLVPMMMLPMLHEVKERANEIICMSHTTMLQVEVVSYAEANGGKLPSDWSELDLDPSDPTPENPLVCPTAEGPGPHYELVHPGAVLADLPEDAVLVREIDPIHDGKRHLGRKNGATELSD